jgi:hypothetical protein
MKKIKISNGSLLLGAIFALLACVVLSFAIAGCTLSSQTTAYKTIGGVEVGGVTAYDDYCLGLANGTISTNSIPQVSAAFTQLQSDCLLAATIASQGTNAIATTNILSDATLLTSAISTAKSIK